MANSEYERAISAAKSARRVGHLVSFIGRAFMVLSVIASLGFVVLVIVERNRYDGTLSPADLITYGVAGLLVNLLLFGALAAVGANTRSNAAKALYELSASAAVSAPGYGASSTSAPTSVTPSTVVVSPAPTGVSFEQPTPPVSAPRPTLNVPAPPNGMQPPQFP